MSSLPSHQICIIQNCNRKRKEYNVKCCYACGFPSIHGIDHTTECDKARINELEEKNNKQANEIKSLKKELKSLKKEIIGIANLNNDEDDDVELLQDD